MSHSTWNNTKFGTDVRGSSNLCDVMQKAEMDFTVSKRQLSCSVPGTENYTSVPYYGVFRNDNNTPLGFVGEQYEPIQIHDAFDFVDSVVSVSNGSYDVAGILGKGERFFVSAKLPVSIAPNRAKDDDHNVSILFSSSNDGSSSATACLLVERIVCGNQINARLFAKALGTILKFRHTQSAKDRLNRAKALFEGAQYSIQDIQNKLSLLCERKPTKEERKRIMAGIFGKDWMDSAVKRNQVERIGELFQWNDNNAFPQIKDSAYNWLQAVTNWVDHERSVRKTDSVSELSEQQIRAQGAVFGTGADLKEKALEVILRETEHSPAMPAMPMHFNAPKPVIVHEPKSIVDDILSNVTV